MSSDLLAKTTAALAFDRGTDARPDEENDVRYTYHSRIAPVHAALLASLQTADRILRDPVYTSQIALTAWEQALAALARVVGADK